MGRKKRYIEKLSEEQKSSLEKGYVYGKSHSFRRKCQGILLSHAGKSIEELCQLFDVGRQSIYRWFNEWESQGIEGLKLQAGRGRPTILDLDDPHQVKTIKTFIENEPKNLNRVLDQVKFQLDVDLSKKTLKRFLKNLNTSGSDSEDV